MNTHNYKLKICKFFLNNKCKLGRKCSFEHLSLCEIERLITKLKDTQLDNNLLKKKINEAIRQDINLKNKANFSVSDVHAWRKPLYSSFFVSKNDKQLDTKTNDYQDKIQNEQVEIEMKDRVKIPKTPKEISRYNSTGNHSLLRSETDTNLNHHRNLFEKQIAAVMHDKTTKQRVKESYKSSGYEDYQVFKQKIQQEISKLSDEIRHLNKNSEKMSTQLEDITTDRNNLADIIETQGYRMEKLEANIEQVENLVLEQMMKKSKETQLILKAQNCVMESCFTQVVSALNIKGEIRVQDLRAIMIQLL